MMENVMNEFKSWEEMSDLEQAQCTYWDMYKDAYGVRPRGIDTSAWTVEDFDREFAELGGIIDREEEDRKEREAEASVRFENQITSLVQSGARDRQAAMVWIHEAEGSNGDNEYLCFLLGLRYGYFRKVA